MVQKSTEKSSLKALFSWQTDRQCTIGAKIKNASHGKFKIDCISALTIPVRARNALREILGSIIFEIFM